MLAILRPLLPLAAALLLLACDGEAVVDGEPGQRPAQAPPPTGWLELEGLPAGLLVERRAHALAVTPGGLPVVVWEDAAHRIRVHRWQGDRWQQLGPSWRGQRPALAIRSSGMPLVLYWTEQAEPAGAWQARVAQFDGEAWQPKPAPAAEVVAQPPLPDHPRGSLTLDRRDLPRVALPDGTAPEQLVVRRWIPGMGWFDETPGLNLDTRRRVMAPQLATPPGAPERLWLAWLEVADDDPGSARGFLARQLAPDDWEAASPPGFPLRAPTLAVDLSGRPVLAGQRGAGAGPSLVWQADLAQTADVFTGWWQRAEFAHGLQPALAIRGADEINLAITLDGARRGVQLLQWVGNDWLQLGGELPGEHPTLAFANSRRYVATQDAHGRLRVFQLSPGARERP